MMIPSHWLKRIKFLDRNNSHHIQSLEFLISVIAQQSLSPKDKLCSKMSLGLRQSDNKMSWVEIIFCTWIDEDAGKGCSCIANVSSFGQQAKKLNQPLVNCSAAIGFRISLC